MRTLYAVIPVDVAVMTPDYLEEEMANYIANVQDSLVGGASRSWYLRGADLESTPLSKDRPPLLLCCS